MGEMHELGVGEVAEAIRRGELGRREVVQAALERVDALDEGLNAFVEVRQEALEEAEGAEGPLAGVPLAVKDVLVDGDRAPTAGSHVGGHWLRGTAEAVARLRRAGAVVLGYANLHEWGLGMTSAVSAYGAVRNPWDPSRSPGGSSGGSAAAVAAGLVAGAIGTDAGGSIRCPAALCGVVGLKPTWGRVPTSGFVEDGSPIDHIGPIARSAGDVAALLDALVGGFGDAVDAAALRVGVARRHFFDNLDPSFETACEEGLDAVRSVVAELREVDVVGAEAASYAIGLILLPLTAELLRDDLERSPEAFQSPTRRLLMLGAGMTDEDRANGEAARRLLLESWAEVFSNVDVVVTPTMPAPPPRLDELTLALPLGESAPDIAYLPLTGPMNLGGVPALSLPCAETEDGWPVSLTLTAARGRDEVVLALGRAVEDALGGRYSNRIAPL